MTSYGRGSFDGFDSYQTNQGSRGMYNDCPLVCVFLFVCLLCFFVSFSLSNFWHMFDIRYMYFDISKRLLWSCISFLQVNNEMFLLAMSKICGDLVSLVTV